MRLQELGEDVFVAVGDILSSASAVFINGDEVLLVDGMASREDASDLRQLVEIDLGKRVRFIVCTHYFSDHLAAASLFPQAQIIAHKNYREVFDSEKYRTEEEKSWFVEPTVLVSDELTLRWGRFTLNVFYNPGHTSGTLNIDVPEADLLMVGDNIVGGIVYLSYSTPKAFQSALQLLREKARSRVIEGHQGECGREVVDKASYYLSGLQERIESIYHNSLPPQSILEIDIASCLGPDADSTDFENKFHRRNLETILERNFFAPAS